MLSFFVNNASAFLVMGLTALGALALRAFAKNYAEPDRDEKDSL